MPEFRRNVASSSNSATLIVKESVRARASVCMWFIMRGAVLYKVTLYDFHFNPPERIVIVPPVTAIGGYKFSRFPVLLNQKFVSCKFRVKYSLLLYLILCILNAGFLSNFLKPP